MIAAIIGLLGTLATVATSIVVASRRDDAPQQHPPDPPVAKAVPKNDGPPPPRVAVEAKPEPPAPTLDGILEILDRYHQRATFGAVAGLLGRDPQSLFQGYTRTPRTSWVVSKSTGLPTGTRKKDYPPELLEKERVISTTEDLRRWLQQNH